MAKESETIKNVPLDRVGTIVQGFAADGARVVTVKKNTSGKTFSIIAEW